MGVMALSIVLLSVPSATAVVSSFSDVKGYMPEYQAIEYLRDNEVVQGYGDGTFGSDLKINRAEFLKIVMEISDYEEAGSDCYNDVSNQWYAPYICKATDLNLVAGYEDGSFGPEQDINFAEASKIVVNTLGITKGQSDSAIWFAEFVRGLESLNAIPSNINGFDHKLTRAEMAEIVWRIDTETTYDVSNTYSNMLAGKSLPARGGELESFDSCSELQTYIENNSVQAYRYVLDDDLIEETSDFGTEEAVVLAKSSESAADEFSTTNIQVAGVDEADIVKNDGEYIYMIKDSTVRIIKAYPPEDMEEVAEVNFGSHTEEDFWPTSMFVDGDTLVVIGQAYKHEWNHYRSYSTLSTVFIYDISDHSNPEFVRMVDIEGFYDTSRKVGDTLYMVLDRYVNTWDWDKVDEVGEDVLVPLLEDSATGEAGAITGCSDIMYVPGVDGTTAQTVVVAIPLDDSDGEIGAEVIMGASGDIYASRDNLYIAEPRYDDFYWYEDSGNTEETYIHKFLMDETDLDYEGMGIVPGTVNNQFSMDEDGDYFRVATSTGSWWGGREESENNVYVLDEDLEVVGSLEGLAEGESIYSTRFIGDRLYMVTFETIDPLFVIDLSSPSNPKVLGELHIPGVSDYLHPLDENHLIGFGLDTDDPAEMEDAGWSWFQGVKLSLFDVSDVENPIEVDKVVIGDRGTFSELSYNHKALMFDAEKGIMAFPITVAEIPQEVKDDIDVDGWVYGDYTFQGAYVYDVDQDGFDLRGTISHFSENELGDDFEYYYNYYYGDDKDIDRILYMGDYFYTVSPMKVKANEMDSLDEEAVYDIAQG